LAVGAIGSDVSPRFVIPTLAAPAAAAAAAAAGVLLGQIQMRRHPFIH